LSGTPTQTGSFSFAVTATDADGCQGTANLTLTVAQGPPGGTGGPPPAHSPPPAISSARLSNHVFRAATHGTSLARQRTVSVGTTIRYWDSEAAATTVTVLRLVTGHKKGRGCLRGRPHKHQRRCTLRLAVGSFSHTDVAGANPMFFTGRINRRKL